MQPRWGRGGFARPVTQGSRCAATLGFRMKALRARTCCPVGGLRGLECLIELWRRSIPFVGRFARSAISILRSSENTTCSCKNEDPTNLVEEVPTRSRAGRNRMKVMGRRCFIGVSPLSTTNKVHAIESIEETGLREKTMEPWMKREKGESYDAR